MHLFLKSYPQILSKNQETKGSPIDGQVALIFKHCDLNTLFTLYGAEWFVFCALLVATRFGCRNHLFIDHPINGYILMMVIFAPIWSVISTLLDWRNDRWIASLVRESKEAADPAVRLAAAAKLARLGPGRPHSS